MSLTYRQLLDKLENMDVGRLDDNVTVYLMAADEFIPVEFAQIIQNSDVIEDGAMILKANY